MRAYLAQFRIRFVYNLQYRTAAYAGCATQFFWGSMLLLLFWTLHKYGADVFPMEFNQLSSYIWLQQATIAMFSLWKTDGDILQMIMDGNVAYEIVRPVEVYEIWYVRNFAGRVADVVLRCIPIFILGAILPKPFCISLPASPAAFLWFLLSFILGCGITVGSCMLIYISTFWTLSAVGLRSIFSALTELLAGSIIPIPFMPEAVQKVLYILPFASMQSAPFLIYTGYMVGTDCYRTIFWQIIWFVIIVFGGRLLMHRALKRVIVQGG